MADDKAAWPHIGNPSDGVNEVFHEAYKQARLGAQCEAPVFAVIDDALFVVHGKVQRQIPIRPRGFHVLKSVAHAPVGLYMMLSGLAGPLTADVGSRLGARKKQFEDAAAALAKDVEDFETARVAKAVLDCSVALVHEIQQAGKVEASRLDAFAKTQGAALLQLTHLATQIELQCLDKAVNAAVAPLSPDERAGLQVVVAGDHQARERSLAMQYFRKWLDEPVGAEERLAYAEGVADIDAAVALVGVRRLDRKIAVAFFGEAKRLQRDVLGDAAKALLDGVKVVPMLARP